MIDVYPPVKALVRLLLAVLACLLAGQTMAGPRVYVAAKDHYGNETIATISPLGNTVIRNVALPTGDEVADLAASTQSLDVWIARGDRLDAYNTLSGAVTSSLQLSGDDEVRCVPPSSPACHVLALDNSGQRLYALSTNSNRLLDIAVVDKLVSNSAYLGNYPLYAQLALSGDDAALLVTEASHYTGRQRVSLYSPLSLQPFGTVEVEPFYWGSDIAATHPVSFQLFYMGDEEIVGEINLASGLKAQIGTGATPNGWFPAISDLLVHPAGTRLYVIFNVAKDDTSGCPELLDPDFNPYCLYQQRVGVIDTWTRSQITSVLVPYATELGILPDGSRLYVSQEAEDSITVIDTATNLIVDTIQIESPSQIAVGGGLPPFGASLEALHSATAYCYNDSTGDRVAMELGDYGGEAGELAFDCKAAGLRYGAEDQLRMTIEGVREAISEQ